MTLNKIELRSLRVALRMAIDYELSCIDAMSRGRHVIKGGFKRLIQGAYRSDVLKAKRRIARWRLILTRLDGDRTP